MNLYYGPPRGESCISRIFKGLIILLALSAAIVFAYAYATKEGYISEAAGEAVWHSASDALLGIKETIGDEITPSAEKSDDSSSDPEAHSGAKMTAQEFSDSFNSKTSSSTKLNDATNDTNVKSEIYGTINAVVKSDKNNVLTSFSLSGPLARMADERNQQNFMEAIEIAFNVLSPGETVDYKDFGIDTSSPTSLLKGVDVEKQVGNVKYSFKISGLSVKFSAEIN